MTGPTRFCVSLVWAMSRRGWTSPELARRMSPEWNTTPEAARRRVRRYLAGTQSPKLETVEILADILGVCPCDLAFGREA